jgi:hypothetical protein
MIIKIAPRGEGMGQKTSLFVKLPEQVFVFKAGNFPPGLVKGCHHEFNFFICSDIYGCAFLS